MQGGLFYGKISQRSLFSKTLKTTNLCCASWCEENMLVNAQKYHITSHELLTDLSLSKDFSKKISFADFHNFIWTRLSRSSGTWTSVWPKPRSTFGIGVRADFFFSKLKFQIFLLFATSFGHIGFYKPENKPRSSKII